MEEDLFLNHAYVEVDGYMEEVDADGLLNVTVEYVEVTEEFGVVAGDVQAEEFVLQEANDLVRLQDRAFLTRGAGGQLPPHFC